MVSHATCVLRQVNALVMELARCDGAAAALGRATLPALTQVIAKLYRTCFALMFRLSNSAFNFGLNGCLRSPAEMSAPPMQVEAQLASVLRIGKF